MILNKFIRFIIQIYKALCYKCRSVFKITHLMRNVIFPALTINFALFRKHLAHFLTPLTVQDTSKLPENERNTGRCSTQSSGKGMNC